MKMISSSSFLTLHVWFSALFLKLYLTMRTDPDLLLENNHQAPGRLSLQAPDGLTINYFRFNSVMLFPVLQVLSVVVAFLEVGAGVSLPDAPVRDGMNS